MKTARRPSRARGLSAVSFLLALSSPIFFLTAPAPSAAQVTQTAPFEKQLADAAARQRDSKADPVRDVLGILAGGAPTADAASVVASIKSNWPRYEEGAPIRVLPEVRSNLVTEGKEYARFLSVVKPLLKFCGLEARVRPLLFKSEVPVTMFSFPNALIFSTRAVALLDDAEVEAMAAHELLHLVTQPLKVKAVDERDERALRLVELFCDAGGAALLASRGGDPRKMISGLNKMNAVLEVEFQEYQRGTKHPPMKTRKQLNDALAAMLGASKNTDRAARH